MCPCRRTNRSRPTAFAVVTAVVNNLDSPELSPCKSPQMRRTFEAFAAMLYRHAVHVQEKAA
jgi:hypothetical protein